MQYTQVCSNEINPQLIRRGPCQRIPCQILMKVTGGSSMHILVTGGTGFIGRPLCKLLLEQGHEVSVLTRQSMVDSPSLRYLASLDEIDSKEVVHAVINLAGASLADKRWTQRYKNTLLASRLDGSDKLTF
ncbi:MAG: nucleoside-diphosphate-sugar epimerase [Halioglobus sp.]|jgi:nucleoside-diphosphate-sugar epimerase